MTSTPTVARPLVKTVSPAPLPSPLPDAPCYKVCVIGLGPVGAVSALAYAKQGHHVTGIDINPERAAAFAQGSMPFVEPGLAELLTDMQQARRFTAAVATDAAHTIRDADIIMLAVGTPSGADGSPDLSYLEQAAATLGNALNGASNVARKTDTAKIIALRSTVPPGTLQKRLGPIIENHSGLRAGQGFHLVANPEFMREGHAIADFFSPSRVVIGTESMEAATKIQALYRETGITPLITDIETAEFAKYIDNSWHALKVAFANEIGRTVRAFGGDPVESMAIFCADGKLNLSRHYLMPGAAFGGSCLPKDVRGAQWIAAQHDLPTPLLDSILPSNSEHIRYGLQHILATNPQRVGLLGIAFKAGIDDWRESPSLFIAAQLLHAGIEVLAHDESIPLGTSIPLPDSRDSIRIQALDELTHNCDVLVRFHRIDAYSNAALAAHDIPVIDLTTV